MSEERRQTPLLKFISNTFSIDAIIALADHGRVPQYKAIMVEAYKTGLVTVLDYKKASKPWISAEVLNTWEQQGDVADLVKKVEVLVDLSVYIQTADQWVPNENRVTYGPWCLELKKCELKYEKKSLRLTGQLATVVSVLLRAGGKPVTYVEIFEALRTEVFGNNSIKTRVQTLMSRIKLSALSEWGPGITLFEHIPGIGYRALR